MASRDPAVEKLVRQYSRIHNLDPDAVLAVLDWEGGVRWGGAGDYVNGVATSFGPAQLHKGGALPKGKGAAWANSPEGLLYAIEQMAQYAAGLKGHQAIAAIVRRFERPANPDAEIKHALQTYKSTTGNTVNIPNVVGSPVPGNTANLGTLAKDYLQKASPTDIGANSKQLMQLAMQRKAALAATTMQAEYSANMYGGSTVAGGPIRGGGSAFANKVLSIAHAQVGKPYVWGGESPQEGGFDCSGLIDFAFKQAGLDLPGRLTTTSALHLGKSVKGQQLKPLDLLITNGGKHMVMYVGNGQVIAAPHRGEVVQYQPISRFTGDIVDIRRI